MKNTNTLVKCSPSDMMLRLQDHFSTQNMQNMFKCNAYKVEGYIGKNEKQQHQNKKQISWMAEKRNLGHISRADSRDDECVMKEERSIDFNPIPEVTQLL